MKKGLIVICSVIVAAIVLGTIVYISGSAASREEMIGDAYRETTALQPDEDRVLAVYRDFEVTESMVVYQQKMDALLRDPDRRQNLTDAEIVDNILVGRMLLEEADRLGLTATQEECDELLASSKAAYDVPEGKRMLDDLCAGMGITVDEYWAQIAEEAPETISREKVKKYIKDAYRDEHPDATEDEVQAALDDYRAALLESHRDEITYKN